MTVWFRLLCLLEFLREPGGSCRILLICLLLRGEDISSFWCSCGVWCQAEPLLLSLNVALSILSSLGEGMATYSSGTIAVLGKKGVPGRDDLLLPPVELRNCSSYIVLMVGEERSETSCIVERCAGMWLLLLLLLLLLCGWCPCIHCCIGGLISGRSMLMVMSIGM